MIAQYNIKSLPAFIFSSDVEKTEVFSQAASIFDKVDGSYMLKTQELGMPVGKYLESPKVNEGDATFGKADSNVKVVIYSDFQCPYCKILYQSVRSLMRQYGDKVLFDYKEFPLDIHPQANNAALASTCALEQGKYWEYGDRLYQNQTSWGNTKDTSIFKTYAAQVGLNTAQFNQCLDSKKYQSKIDADKAEGGSFGISGTPAVFVNDQFTNGVMSADQLKQAIDGQLNPGSQVQSDQNNQSSADNSPK
jgi:protein-disulfide isomerase